MAESAAPLALESLVHFDIAIAPTDLVAIRIEFSASLVETVRVADLPADWRDLPSPQSRKAIGEDWVSAGRTPVLRVPSMVVPVEPKYLINPGHPQVGEITLSKPQAFSLDPRLF